MHPCHQLEMHSVRNVFKIWTNLRQRNWQQKELLAGRHYPPRDAKLVLMGAAIGIFIGILMGISLGGGPARVLGAITASSLIIGRTLSVPQH